MEYPENIVFKPSCGSLVGQLSICRAGKLISQGYSANEFLKDCPFQYSKQTSFQGQEEARGCEGEIVGLQLQGHDVSEGLVRFQAQKNQQQKLL